MFLNFVILNKPHPTEALLVLRKKYTVDQIVCKGVKIYNPVAKKFSRYRGVFKITKIDKKNKCVYAERVV